jgi:hypothetical protein
VRLYRQEITTRLSCRLNFLAIEVGEYDECMGNNKTKFLGVIKDIGDSANTLSAFYCSKEEAHRPLGCARLRTRLANPVTETSK